MAGPVVSNVQRLSPAEVKRQDKGRALAEQKIGKRGPGRPRKDGSPAQPRAKTPAEAEARVKAASQPQVEADKRAAAPADDWREPTKTEIAMCRQLYALTNRPLKGLQTNLELMGATLEKDEIPMSEGEMDFFATTTAGTLMAISPQFARYFPVAGLAIASISFLASRAMTLVRCRAELEAKGVAAADVQRGLDAARRGETVAPPAAANGTMRVLEGAGKS